MVQMIYVSSSTYQMNEDEVLEILNVSRAYNKKNNITGMLLYLNNTFLQILEGGNPEVEETLERIKKDKRHKNITLLEVSEIEKRSFPDWSMGFKYISEENKDEIEGFSEFLEKDIDPEKIVDSKMLAKLLFLFKENNS